MNPIILVVGARPNFMKIAPLHKEFSRLNIPVILLHTGQHYDEKMSKVFFEDLQIPAPDIYLGVGSGTHAKQTAKVMVEFEKVCTQNSPSMVIVAGDVNSTLACALVSAKLLIPCAHLEAGLRSFDRRMPEEINRIVTDSISDILLTPSPDADENLRNEGIPDDKIVRVGNIMIDTLLGNLKRINPSFINEKWGLCAKEYGVVTLHRPSNVDTFSHLSHICEELAELSNSVPLVFPVHPRTLNRLNEYKLFEQIDKNPTIQLTEPLGYLEFLSLTSQSAFVLTDSGGLQEETTALGIQCFTVRENTERPITITEGTNTLIGRDFSIVHERLAQILNGDDLSSKIPEFWDGKTSGRVVQTALRYLE